MSKIIFFSFILSISCSFSQIETFTDNRDNRTYKTVVIGSQKWMAENLNVSTFRNGDPIPEAKHNTLEWENAFKNKQPAWCYYPSYPMNEIEYGKEYGKLYNWYAVIDPRGLSPSGWHIPSENEWSVLESNVGVDYESKLKASQQYETIISFKDVGGYYENKWVECSNCSYWSEKQKANNPCSVCRNKGGKSIQGKYIPKTKKRVEVVLNRGWDGIDLFGFHAIPGGGLLYKGDDYDLGNEMHKPQFYDLEIGCYFWSSTIDSEGWIKMAYFMSNEERYWGASWTRQASGLTIRCIKD